MKRSSSDLLKIAHKNTMEEGSDELFEDDYENVYPYYQKYLELSTDLIGIICNMLIINIVIRNKLMQLRTNVILVNWSIADLLSGVYTLYQVSSYFSKKDSSKMKLFLNCFMTTFGYMNSLTAVTFMLLLIIPKIMNNKNIRNVSILCAIYITASVIFIADLILCNCRFGPIITILTFVIIIGHLLILIIIKDINRCGKNSANPTSQKTLTRLNIAKIFVYNWTISIFLQFLVYLFRNWYLMLHWRIMAFSIYLTPLYILIYLYKTDEYFKICTLNFLNCNNSSYDVNAAIRFEADCKNELDDD